MATMEIVYYLNEEGRRKSLIAGGDGKHRQRLEVPDDMRVRFLALADIDNDGNATVSQPHWARIVGYEPELGDRVAKECPRQWSEFDDRGRYQIYEPKMISMSGSYSEPVDADAVLSDVELDAAVDPDDWEKSCRRACDDLNARSEIADVKAAAEKWVEEYRAAEDATEARREEKRIEEKQEKAALAAAQRDMVRKWIEKFGSDHLKAILAEGLLDGSMKIYESERLAVQRPGWIFDRDWHNGDVEHRDIRNPSPVVLQWLHDTKQKFPDVQLHWAHLNKYDELNDMWLRIREPIIVDEYIEFLGQTVVLRMEADNAD